MVPARSHKPFDAGSNPASATLLRAGQCSAGSHKPGSQVRSLGPQLSMAGYAKPVKRPGRGPGVCGFDSHLGYCMVLRCYGGTPLWYGGSPGSTPGWTSGNGLLVEEEDAAVARRKSGCDSPAVH